MYSLEPLVLAIAAVSSDIALSAFAQVQDSSAPAKSVDSAAQKMSAEAESAVGRSVG